MTLDLEANAGTGRRTRPGVPRLLLVLAALLGGACVSVRPWRDCYPPGDPRQLAQAGQVQVLRLDGSEVRLRHARLGADSRGRYLSGKVARAAGRRAAEVRVDVGEICAVRTRRIEPRRVATNLVLAPLAVGTAMVLLMVDSRDGVIDTDGIVWSPPRPEPPPRACPWASGSRRRFRRRPAASPPGRVWRGPRRGPMLP